MRTLPKLLLVTLAVATSWARPAFAEPPPTRSPEPPSATPSFEPILPRFNVASLGPLGPLPVLPRFRWSSGYQASRPLRTTGIVVLSLGVATMFAAGVTAIVAATSASDLEDECPGGKCVEDTRGGRSYSRALDSARATDWLIGIGMPVLASGTVMLIYSAVLERNNARAWPTTVLRASPTGATLAVHF